MVVPVGTTGVNGLTELWPWEGPKPKIFFAKNRGNGSAIPQMQRMLNKDKKKEIETLHQLNMPVNNDYCKSLSLR